ncbi:ABC transporter substrate-binding protein [Carboxydothermus pertinax]|uniref:ABC transporter substrate-binding protein n=1 Tax=Carboxydothermus pertinax TaxID=870242 RepID=UPI00096A2774|nr:ABC transporter substrate-binding protein [Carboxydothermus pertinax]
MRRKLKVLSLLVIGILFLTLGLSGCGKKEAGPVTLNALYMKQAGYSEDDIRQMTEAFMKENPNIKVNLTFVPYEALHDKIVTSAAAGTGGFDVALVDCIWTPELAQAGFIKDITGKIDQNLLNDIFPGVLSAVEYNGKLYGMPWLNDTKYLFYNKEILEKAGIKNPPATWDELLADARIIKNKGLVKYPIIWSWAQAEAVVCDYTTLVGAFGGEIIDKNGNPVLNQGAGLEALKFMKKSLDEGLSNPASRESLEEDVRRIFSQGEAAFAINWTYMYNLANDPKESKVAGKVEIALMPGSDKAKSASVNGGMGLAILKNTKHEEEALKYLLFMANKDNQKKYAKLALPIYKSLYNDPEVKKGQEKLVEIAQEQYQYIVNRPQVSWYPELSQALQVEIQNALLGKKTPEQALNDVAAKVKQLKK